MAFDPITSILNIGNTLIDRLIPDKTQSAAAKAQLLQMQLAGEFDLAKGQLTVNAAEAGNQSLFVAGWRPFVGWGCGFAFIYTYILHPMTLTIAALAHSNVDISKLPPLDISQMMPVLLGMLGLGAMRSYDKAQGNGNGH